LGANQGAAEHICTRARHTRRRRIVPRIEAGSAPRTTHPARPASSGPIRTTRRTHHRRHVPRLIETEGNGSERKAGPEVEDDKHFPTPAEFPRNQHLEPTNLGQRYLFHSSRSYSETTPIARGGRLTSRQHRGQHHIHPGIGMRPGRLWERPGAVRHTSQSRPSSTPPKRSDIGGPPVG